MSRADKVLAQVAAGMQDSGVIREAIADAIRAAFREGDESSFIADIAHHVAEASNGVTQAHRESHAHRLLNAMERYARAALTEAAESDIPLDEDETCPKCSGELWVCENHMESPWSMDYPNGCMCGCGKNCSCNPHGFEPPGFQVLAHIPQKKNS